MVTREQIEKRILSLEDAASHYAGSDAGNGFAQDLDAYRLALAHLDSERARRVGEAVIASMSADGLTADDLTNFDSFDDRDGYPVSVPHFDLSDVLRAIAAALRGEP